MTTWISLYRISLPFILPVTLYFVIGFAQFIQKSNPKIFSMNFFQKMSTVIVQN